MRLKRAISADINVERIALDAVLGQMVGHVPRAAGRTLRSVTWIMACRPTTTSSVKRRPGRPAKLRNLKLDHRLYAPVQRALAFIAELAGTVALALDYAGVGPGNAALRALIGIQGGRWTRRTR